MSDMNGQSYLSWMSQNTPTEWTNDSGIMSQLDSALENGAVGGTTNPPLSYEALQADSDLYSAQLARLRRDCSDDEFAVEAMGLVVRNIAEKLLPMHKEKGSYYGCIRAQVKPSLRDDAEGMLAMGKLFASWGENIMVKIPVTEAGIWVLEELAAQGIKTTPTINTTMSQAVAAAEAYERGYARAVKNGVTPAPSTEAIVHGRLQDYLAKLCTERGINLMPGDLDWASIALLKRSHQIFTEKKYKSVIMGAAFRCAMHVEQLVGGLFCSTIHPKVQKMVEAADAAGTIKRESCIDQPADPIAVARVLKAIPEYRLAYEPDAIKPRDFSAFGSNKMTLDFFDLEGWQKIAALRQG